MATIREYAFVLLRAVYEETNGDVSELVSLEEIVKRIGMERPSAKAAFGYLSKSHLIKDSREMAELPHVFITAPGINAIEEAVGAPQTATSYFPAVYNITIGHMTGGAIQQATVSSHQVHAVINLSDSEMPQLVRELGELRSELSKIATSPEHYVAIGHVAAAQIAAQGNDAAGVESALGKLGKAGTWVLDLATKIGVGAIASVLSKLILPN